MSKKYKNTKFKGYSKFSHTEIYFNFEFKTNVLKYLKSFALTLLFGIETSRFIVSN